MPIQVLSEFVAAQIAAGEVVERPASVVKELLENALDAGARAIRIDVGAGGRRLIRVTDDGCGIPSDEVELAFARHATSKLRTIDDLDHIQTLGFRGEALASIASVAHVTLLTRTAGETAGTQLRVGGGRPAERQSVGVPTGTSVTVENLFFNTPARLKFMKSDATERRHIDTIVTRYAMAYPNVRFTLSQDERVTFATTGSGDLADVLVEALGLDIMRDMLEVTPLESARPDLPSIRVYGYTGAPHLNRNTRSHIMLFVNGRYIQDASLSYAVSQAYHTLVPPDRYPVAVLMISLDPGDVDVNVHPTKAEVRFRSPDAVFSAVQRAVRRVVMARSGVPLAGLGESKAANEPAPWRTAVPSSGANQLDLDLPPYDAGRHSRQVIDQEAEADSQPSAMAPETDRPETRPRSLPPMRVIGQAAATYIIAEGPAGLYLVDQHAAHERILYERFMHDQAKHRPVAQHTLNAVTLQLPPEAVRLLEESLEGLHKVGFEIEPFGGNTIRVRAIPAVLADRDPEEAVRVLLDDLEVGEEPAASTQEARIILRVCKAAAVKAGQTLSYEEMRELMRQLERCESPRTCPHGRPTMIHISAAQLAKEFGRT